MTILIKNIRLEVWKMSELFDNTDTRTNWADVSENYDVNLFLFNVLGTI